MTIRVLSEQHGQLNTEGHFNGDDARTRALNYAKRLRNAETATRAIMARAGIPYHRVNYLIEGDE